MDLSPPLSKSTVESISSTNNSQAFPIRLQHSHLTLLVEQSVQLIDQSITMKISWILSRVLAFSLAVLGQSTKSTKTCLTHFGTASKTSVPTKTVKSSTTFYSTIKIIVTPRITIVPAASSIKALTTLTKTTTLTLPQKTDIFSELRQFLKSLLNVL